MAERIYEVVANGAPFPDYLFVDPRMPLQVFGKIAQAKRLEVYGGFLNHLKLWQQNYLFQALRRWPYMWDWSGRLRAIVESFNQAQKAKESAG
jgi:hypothetical protein